MIARVLNTVERGVKVSAGRVIDRVPPNDFGPTFDCSESTNA